MLWEKRSKVYKEHIGGVLPKSFPQPVNKYLHNWMFEKIKIIIPEDEKIRVLDLGCGYGRLSKEILDSFPKALTFGIDLSDTYINLYNKSLTPRGKALKGDIRKLPYKSAYFDVVFMVTTLMYITNAGEQEKVMREIFRVLRPGGKFVIIERNSYAYALITLWGFVSLLRGKKFKEIPAVSFSASFMKSLISKGGGCIKSMQGIPLWTLSLPFLFLLSWINTYSTHLVLIGVSILDRKFSALLTSSLYIAYIGEKKNDSI